MELTQIIKAGGGQAKLAAALNISRSAISEWRRVPPHHVPGVARHTGLPRHQIRPDLYEAPGEEAA